MDVGWEEHDFLFGILDQDTVFVDPPIIWRADLAQLHKESHWAKPSAVRHGQPIPSHQAGTDGACVALRPDPGFQGNPSIYPALPI